MSEQQLVDIVNGISSGDNIYYNIGSGILAVFAGMWGFRKVKELLGGGESEWESGEDYGGGCGPLGEEFDFDPDDPDLIGFDDGGPVYRDESEREFDAILAKLNAGEELSEAEVDILWENSVEVPT